MLQKDRAVRFLVNSTSNVSIMDQQLDTSNNVSKASQDSKGPNARQIKAAKYRAELQR